MGMIEREIRMKYTRKIMVAMLLAVVLLLSHGVAFYAMEESVVDKCYNCI